MYSVFTMLFDIIAMVGTSDQSCWLAKACKILLLLLVGSGAYIFSNMKQCLAG